MYLENPKPHCDLCGRENPRTDQGYTTCCSEFVCDGNYTFEGEDGNTYCCVGYHDQKLRE